jgi:hypothetical protein
LLSGIITPEIEVPFARSFIVVDILNLHAIPVHVLFQRTSTAIACEFVEEACSHSMNGIGRSTAAVDVSRWGLAVKIWTRQGAIALQRSEYS